MHTDHIRWVVDNWENSKPVTKPGSGRLKLPPVPEVCRDPDGLPVGDAALEPPSQWSVDPSWLNDPTSQDSENLRKKREAWLPPKPPVPVIDLPFELPYRLCLPDRDVDRWRLHSGISLATSRHTKETLLADGSPDADDPFLKNVVRADDRNQQAMMALAKGQPLPEQPEHFQKVVRILEESVRGFDVQASHGNFWACKTRDEFIRLSLGSEPIVDPDFDPTTSPLVNMITSIGLRMPLGRPAIPAERLAFIQQWIQAQCPDHSPAGQIGLVREGKSCEPPGNGSGGTPQEQMLNLIEKKLCSALQPTFVHCFATSMSPP